MHRDYVTQLSAHRGTRADGHTVATNSNMYNGQCLVQNDRSDPWGIWWFFSLNKFRDPHTVTVAVGVRGVTRVHIFHIHTHIVSLDLMELWHPRLLMTWQDCKTTRLAIHISGQTHGSERFSQAPPLKDTSDRSQKKQLDLWAFIKVQMLGVLALRNESKLGFTAAKLCPNMNRVSHNPVKPSASEQWRVTMTKIHGTTLSVLGKYRQVMG